MEVYCYLGESDMPLYRSRVTYVYFILEIDRENDEPGQVRTDKTRGGNKFSLILVLILTKENKRKT